MKTGLWIGISVLLAACAGDGVGRIGPEELFGAIQKGTAPTVVDVRSEGEYIDGHVPGAIHVPFYSTWGGDPRIDANKDKPVVVYCEHGPRAGLARLSLERAGYEKVLYLDGHMAGWNKRGLPRVKGHEK